MCADDYWITSHTVVSGNDITDGVGKGKKLQPYQVFSEDPRAISFIERRGRYFRKPDLVGHNVGFVFSNKEESFSDARISEDLVNAIAHYLTSNETGSDSIDGCATRLPMT